MSESVYKNFLVTNCKFDSAHDLSHIQRVVSNAKKLLDHENADAEIVIAACWLHDCVILPKNHPDRNKASQMAGKKAFEFLKTTGFSTEKLEGVVHAIEAHSFSAGIMPKTIEAKIVQDADRLDALGAIGITRCFLVSGELNRPLYNSEDPFCKNRNPDDSLWTIDHFYTKLYKLPETMNTKTAKKEAEKRVRFMKKYLEVLGGEIGE